MALRDLIPWRKVQHDDLSGPARAESRDLLREMMEDFLRPVWPALTGFAPAMNISETDEEYRVTIELPGTSKDDVEVTVQEGQLTMSGEKKEEEKEEKENYSRVERRYGSFRRSVPLPADVKEEEVEASFKNGVLSVRLPKAPGAAGKRVEIKDE